jgi:hypothetical protein
MAAKGVIAPRLPAAPVEYDRLYIDTMLGILRQYFDQLDNAGPILVSTQRKPAQGSIPAEVISALSCAQPNPTSPAVYVISLPTQADFALLRSGDIYYDTSGGSATSYPLRIKA